MLGPSTWRRESLVAEKTARVSVESRTKIVGGSSRERSFSAESEKTREGEGCFRKE